MKWYFASRTKHKQKLADFSKLLEDAGETIQSQWVYVTDPLIPFTSHTENAQNIAIAAIEGVLASDIFVLISDPAGTDMFAELGAALAKYSAAPESIRIYVVGEHAKRSLIQLHPGIIHLSTIKEAVEKEGIRSINFDFSTLN